VGKTAERFEDLEIWQEAQELTKILYGDFKTCTDYDFKSQILRAALSVGNNIAEGFERKSNKEFSHFLYISKGSCGEVRSMLYLTQEFGYINPPQNKLYQERYTTLSKRIFSLIKALTSRAK
jgi:four helix bundle protein